MTTPATLPDTPNIIGGNFMPDAFGAAVKFSTGINKMIADIAAAWNIIGSEAIAAALLPYVRLHNGTSQGLLVPTSALMGPDISINGNFDHFTRVLGSGVQTSTTTYNKVTSYAADRFFVLPAGASVTQQRSTSVPINNLSQYSLLVNGAASVTTVDIGQRYEAAVVNDRCRTTLAFSAFIRNDTGAAFTPNLRVGTPAAADDFTTVTNRLDVALQLCADAAWTFVYGTFDPSGYTNIANGMEVALRVPTGVLVATKTAKVSQWSLRPGQRPMGFIPPDPALELWRSQRYSRTFGGTLAAEVAGFGFVLATATSATAGIPLSPPMRILPTATLSAASDWGVQIAGPSIVAATALSVESNTSTPSLANMAVTTAAGLTAGAGCRLIANSTTNARLHLVGEL